MATTNDNYAYTYDPTGKLPDNLIKHERHDVQPPTGIEDSSLFFLRAAPAFQESIILRKGPTETSPRLVEGQDYILTHKFLWKSWELTKPIYGSVTMINRNYNGEVYATYQTLGGAYVVDDQTYLERLSRDIYRSRYVYWEQVSKNLPGLPPFDHTMSGTDTVGWDLVVDSILRLVAAIYDTANGSGGGGTGEGSVALTQHINSSTAHKLSSVGGGNLFNYALANDADFENEALNKYTNPAAIVLWVRRYITSLGLGTVSNDVQQLRLKVNDIESKLNNLRDDVVAQKLILDEIGDEFDKLKKRQDATEENVATAIGDIPGIKDDIESIKRQLSGEDDTGIGKRVSTLETTVAKHTTDIGKLNEAKTDHESRLISLESGGGTGPGPGGDIEQRLATAEQKIATNDTAITEIKRKQTVADLGYDPAALVFQGRVGRAYTLKPNDLIQIEYVTPGRFTTDSVYDSKDELYKITGVLSFSDGTSERAFMIGETLTESNGAITDASWMFKTANITLLERTVGTLATGQNGAAGKVLQGITYGRGCKATKSTVKGSGSGTYFKAQYKNTGTKDVVFHLEVTDISHSILKANIPTDVTNQDMSKLDPYLRGEAGYLVTVTKGA